MKLCWMTAIFVPTEPTVPRRVDLDGLILVIEGVGRTKSDGHSVLQALGVISFDEQTATYRMRAFNDGRFLESEVTLAEPR